MIGQKKVIEAIEVLDYRQHATNKTLWYKPVGTIKYTVSIAGINPIIKILENGDEIFDENDEELLKVQAAIDTALSKTTPNPKQESSYESKKPAETKKPDETPSDHMIKCELCPAEHPKSTMAQVGYPTTHTVCQDCATKITQNEINKDEWYEEKPAESGKSPDAIPEEKETTSTDSADKTPDAPEQLDKPIQSDMTDDLEQPDEPQTTSISSRIHGIIPQLAERGKIKIGFKGEVTKSRTSGKEFRLPKKDNHFTITTTAKNEEGNFIIDQEIMDKIGDNCTSLDIMVLYNDPDLIFRTSYAFFQSSRCECRGDGQTAITRNGETIECDPNTCESFIGKACKPNGVLSVILMDAPMVGGLYVMRTSSWNTIRNITSSLDTLKSLTFGQLAGLPLALTLQPKTVLIPGSTKTTVVYIANIEFKGSMQELLDQTMQIANKNADTMHEIKRIENNARLMLNEAPTPDECKDIAEEFYPENIIKEIEGHADE